MKGCNYRISLKDDYSQFHGNALRKSFVAWTHLLMSFLASFRPGFFVELVSLRYHIAPKPAFTRIPFFRANHVT